MSYAPCSLCKCRECSTCRLCIERRTCAECPRCQTCVVHACCCPPKSPPLFPNYQKAIQGQRTICHPKPSTTCLSVPSMTCLSAPSFTCTFPSRSCCPQTSGSFTVTSVRCPSPSLCYPTPSVCCTKPSVCCTKPSVCCTQPSLSCTQPSICCTQPSICCTQPSICCTKPSIFCSTPPPCCPKPCKCGSKPTLYSNKPSEVFCLNKSSVCADTVEMIRRRSQSADCSCRTQPAGGVLCAMEKSPGCYIPVKCESLRKTTKADQEERLTPLSPSVSFHRMKSCEEKAPTPDLVQRRDIPDVCADRPPRVNYSSERLPVNVNPPLPQYPGQPSTSRAGVMSSRDELVAKTPRKMFKDDPVMKSSKEEKTAKREKRKEEKQSRKKDKKK